jgi:hypothetical protein
MSKGGVFLLPNAPRKTAPPLEISNLPGYDKLTETEHEICASIRLVPEAYIEFRNALVNECKKNGTQLDDEAKFGKNFHLLNEIKDLTKDVS